MQRSELDRVIQKVRRFFDDGTTEMFPAEGFHKASSYADPEWARRELLMLKSKPLVLGHSSQLPSPGDFRTDDSTGVPVLLCRQADGRLRAFLNICRHRGARLCTEGSGNRQIFVCPYHAWTFRADGALKGMPRPEGFKNLDRAKFGLAELPCEERHGLIWIVLDPAGSIDVAAHLGSLDAELASYGMDRMVMERDEFLTYDMNWKFVIDGFLEVYHFAKLHKNSIAPYFYGWHSPFDIFGANGRLIGVRKAFDALREADLSAMDRFAVLKTLAVNYILFPNSVLVWQSDHFECWTAYPADSPGRCRVRVQSITRPEDTGENSRPKWDKNWKILIGTVVAEDWDVSRTIQQGAAYMPDDLLVFGRNEPGLQHFHGSLKREIEAVAD